jgi:hypothetical protein
MGDWNFPGSEIGVHADIFRLGKSTVAAAAVDQPAFEVGVTVTVLKSRMPAQAAAQLSPPAEGHHPEGIRAAATSMGPGPLPVDLRAARAYIRLRLGLGLKRRILLRRRSGATKLSALHSASSAAAARC